jgi:hypothetical protein
MPFRVLLVLLPALLAAPAPAGAAETTLPGAGVTEVRVAQPATYPGLQRMRFEFGPIDITAGQNTIEFEANDKKPAVPGYITRFKPDLVYADSRRRVPRVDVLHLHHGVWLIDGRPTFAAGEEKTIFNAPQGYGFRHDPKAPWVMNHMLHNLTPTPAKAYITYEIDFVPDSAPAAAGITPIKPLWMDVAGLKAYPVFDVLKGSGGADGRYTFPDDARGAERDRIGSAATYTAPEDITLVGTSGHLHPGGLWTDLHVRRGADRRHLFRSEAKYWEPAGAVSWDVAMTATKEDWRPVVRRGDRLELSATYETTKASWYESMGIDVVFYADGVRPEAQDPFTGEVDTRGLLTHGHLAENDNHGGTGPPALPDARRLPSGRPARTVPIRDYIYARGDLSTPGVAGRPPVITGGGTLRFRNLDATRRMTPRDSAYHTITSCRAPCNRSTGIAYPLADGPVTFDSGELGFGPPWATAAANRDTWTTPKRLRPGTYTYFCRIHPFMRGAFRVKRKR